MDTLVAACAGLDVHKDTVVACVRLADAAGGVRKREIRTFSTVSAGLREPAAWLVEHGITDVAIESTGVCWKPVFNILEDHLKVCLVNARDAKAAYPTVIWARSTPTPATWNGCGRTWCGNWRPPAAP